jgi:hypothetical protein
MERAKTSDTARYSFTELNGGPKAIKGCWSERSVEEIEGI